MPLARSSKPSNRAGRRCRRRTSSISSSSRSPARSSSSSSSCSGSRGGSGSHSTGPSCGEPGDSKKNGSKVQCRERHGGPPSGVSGAPLPAKSRWPPRPSPPQPSRCLDALLQENILVAVLPFLEAADATRLGACCTDLHAALTAPRVQPLWRRWFETSGFVWWPYGGACGSSCSLQIDKDGFVLQQKQQQQRQGQQQLQLQLAEAEGRPGTGYRQFSHEGWCCQFLWNARSLQNWKSGTCAFAALHTDSPKLFMVSIHPKGVYASRAEAAPLSPTAAQQMQQSVESPAPDTPRQASQQHRQQHQQQPQKQHQLLDNADAASTSRMETEPLPHPSVHFALGAEGGPQSLSRLSLPTLQPAAYPLWLLSNLNWRVSSAAAAAAAEAAAEQRRAGHVMLPLHQQQLQLLREPEAQGIYGERAERQQRQLLHQQQQVRCGKYVVAGRRELAQLAIEGQLVHRLILNFIFSQNPSRVFGFDRWHREFFVWTIAHAVDGEPLETSAIVNAHTDGILGLDVTETYNSLKVLSGSRDETVSLYSVDPLLRLATFTGHQAEVSAVCWLRNGEASPSGQQCRGDKVAPGVYAAPDVYTAPGVYTAKDVYTDEEIQLFASGAYDGTIKIWDARQADPKSLSASAAAGWFDKRYPAAADASSAAPAMVNVVDSCVTLGASAGNGLTLLEHQNRITRLATAWDGRMLLSGDSEGVVKLWDLRKCADSILTAKYNGAILDLHANRAFCVVRVQGSSNILKIGPMLSSPRA
ncbi:hypothetical protein, conserved [Eimeria brunetti]|uniref:Uncharacterized protein n=1 Tax=Eimeria brunetti TaxID=51314 RepID=U6LV45_9EIME|nr:hypothetical protein, conserved [Eimeria brunetti]